MFCFCFALWEDGETANEAVDAGAKVFIVDSVFSGIHADEGVASDVLEEWAYVDLAEDLAEGICVGIAEHHEFVA